MEVTAVVAVDTGTASEMYTISMCQPSIPKSNQIPRIFQQTVIPSLSVIPCMIGQLYCTSS
jgi:hypothetical protein